MADRIIKVSVLILVLVSSGSAFGETGLDGYMSAGFGMSEKEVRSVFEKDGVIFSRSEDSDGDYLIFAQRKQEWITSELLYVFPGQSDRLALVIEIFPGLLDTKPIHNELTGILGKPSSGNYPEAVLKHMQSSNMIPDGVKQMTIWNITGDGLDREARLMVLNEYVRVEYIDNELMAGK